MDKKFEVWWEETFGYGDYGMPPEEAIRAWYAGRAAMESEHDALTAANIDLTERVLYTERERDELKAEVAKLKGPYGVWESLGEPIEVMEIGTGPYRPHGTWAGLLVPKVAKNGEEPSGECPAGGEHDWVREPEYCTQCFATKED